MGYGQGLLPSTVGIEAGSYEMFAPGRDYRIHGGYGPGQLGVARPTAEAANTFHPQYGLCSIHIVFSSKLESLPLSSLAAISTSDALHSRLPSALPPGCERSHLSA